MDLHVIHNAYGSVNDGWLASIFESIVTFSNLKIQKHNQRRKSIPKLQILLLNVLSLTSQVDIQPSKTKNGPPLSYPVLLSK